jgi:hypothetical protein
MALVEVAIVHGKPPDLCLCFEMMMRGHNRMTYKNRLPIYVVLVRTAPLSNFYLISPALAQQADKVIGACDDG